MILLAPFFALVSWQHALGDAKVIYDDRNRFVDVNRDMNTILSVQRRSLPETEPLLEHRKEALNLQHDDALEIDLKNSLKQKRCSRDSLLGMQHNGPMMRRDAGGNGPLVPVKDFMRKRCEACTNSAKCRNLGRCEPCNKYCSAVKDDHTPTTSTINEKAKVQERDVDVVGRSADSSDNNNVVKSSFSEIDNSYYTIGSFGPGPTQSLLMRLLQVSNKDELERLIVLAKTKVARKTSAVVHPVVIDTAHVFTLNEGTPSTVDLELHPVSKSQQDISQLTSLLNRELDSAIEHKKRVLGNTQLTVSEVDKIIGHALRRGEKIIPPHIPDSLAEEFNIEEHNDGSSEELAKIRPLKTTTSTTPSTIADETTEPQLGSSHSLDVEDPEEVGCGKKSDEDYDDYYRAASDIERSHKKSKKGKKGGSSSGSYYRSGEDQDEDSNLGATNKLDKNDHDGHAHVPKKNKNVGHGGGKHLTDEEPETDIVAAEEPKVISIDKPVEQKLESDSHVKVDDDGDDESMDENSKERSKKKKKKKGKKGGGYGGGGYYRNKEDSVEAQDDKVADQKARSNYEHHPVIVQPGYGQSQPEGHEKNSYSAPAVQDVNYQPPAPVAALSYGAPQQRYESVPALPNSYNPEPQYNQDEEEVYNSHNDYYDDSSEEQYDNGSYSEDEQPSPQQNGQQGYGAPPQPQPSYQYPNSVPYQEPHPQHQQYEHPPAPEPHQSTYNHPAPPVEQGNYAPPKPHYNQEPKLIPEPAPHSMYQQQPAPAYHQNTEYSNEDDYSEGVAPLQDILVPNLPYDDDAYVGSARDADKEERFPATFPDNLKLNGLTKPELDRRIAQLLIENNVNTTKIAEQIKAMKKQQSNLSEKDTVVGLKNMHDLRARFGHDDVKNGESVPSRQDETVGAAQVDKQLKVLYDQLKKDHEYIASSTMQSSYKEEGNEDNLRVNDDDNADRGVEDVESVTDDTLGCKKKKDKDESEEYIYVKPPTYGGYGDGGYGGGYGYRENDQHKMLDKILHPLKAAHPERAHGEGEASKAHGRVPILPNLVQELKEIRDRIEHVQEIPQIPSIPDIPQIHLRNEQEHPPLLGQQQPQFQQAHHIQHIPPQQMMPMNARFPSFQANMQGNMNTMQAFQQKQQQQQAPVVGVAMEPDMNHFGRMVPVDRPLNLHSRDVSEKTQMFFVGDGIRLPIHVDKTGDGTMHLSIDVSKLCNCKNATCTHATEALALEKLNDGTVELEVNEDSFNTALKNLQELEDHKSVAANVPSDKSKRQASAKHFEAEHDSGELVPVFDNKFNSEEMDELMPIKKYYKGDLANDLYNLKDNINKYYDNEDQFRESMMGNVNTGTLDDFIHKRVELLTNVLSWMKSIAIDEARTN